MAIWKLLRYMGGNPPVSRQLDCLTELSGIDWGCRRLPARFKGVASSRVPHASVMEKWHLLPCLPRADKKVPIPFGR